MSSAPILPSQITIENPSYPLPDILDQRTEEGIESDPFISDLIRRTDTDGSYNIYHYVECTGDSDVSTKNNRGVIRTVTGEIVCKTFNYTPEYTDRKSSIAGIELLLADSNIPKTISVYMSEEGTLIRIWNHLNKWHISTHKKLDAKRSRWGSKDSHGDLFEKALIHHAGSQIPCINDEDILKNFLDGLDPTHIYTFVICSNDHNRVVCTPLNHPTLYFAGEFVLRDGPNGVESILLDENTTDFGIDTPQALQFETPSELMDWVDHLSPYRAQGVLIYYGVNTADHGCIKITSAAYQEQVDVRGNIPSIPFRYLQLRSQPAMCDKLRRLYPDMIESFLKYEDIIQIVGQDIYQAYINRYIYHNHVILPREQFFVMQELHNMYLANPSSNRISVLLVSTYIDSLCSTKLNHLIRSHKVRLLNEAQEKVPIDETE